MHIGFVPKLGLIIVNELDNFAENWLEVQVTQNSRSRPLYDIKTLSGDGQQQGVCRYLIESIHDALFNKPGQKVEQIGPISKFIMNLKLRPEVLNNRSHINSLADALVKVLQASLQNH